MAVSTAEVDTLIHRFASVRSRSERLCEPLEIEDYVIQSMTDASPAKWHLAHTTWFFETFVLLPHHESYRVYDEGFAYLFNSYYVQAGDRFHRPSRGLLSRPTVSRVMDYRRHVDAAMSDFLASADEATRTAVQPLVDVGLHHEQQHQELLLTDIKHMLSRNPLHPAYTLFELEERVLPPDLMWIPGPDGVQEIGYDGDGFHFDNEGPRHRIFLEPYELANRPVTNAEFMEFVDRGGYANATLWLSEGFAHVESLGLTHPMYWVRSHDGWMEFTLSGLRPLDPHGPVCHVSLYEADAYARWTDARLPTEAEWEVAAGPDVRTGHYVDNAMPHPVRTSPGPGLRDMYGSTWEWTQSSYAPYPGYRPAAGALGEYNGKFMCNQYVLRGGSCATSQSHNRRSYRNFFPAHARWQFTGIRLARTV